MNKFIHEKETISCINVMLHGLLRWWYQLRIQSGELLKELWIYYENLEEITLYLSVFKACY